MTPELLSAVAALLGAVAWPLVILIIVLFYREPIAKLLQNIESLKFPGVEVKLELESLVEDEAKAQIGEEPKDAAKEVTIGQVEAAERVREFAERHDLTIAQKEMVALAQKYDQIRATMPSGDARTRKLDALVVKMRILALACEPFLDKFASSSSPGERLAAIAILQVKPDPKYYEWLAQRLKGESDFVGYYAAVALSSAVRHAVAKNADRSERSALEQAIEKAKENVDVKSSRRQKLDKALEELKKSPPSEPS